MRLLCGGDEALQFHLTLALLVKAFGVRAGVQLDALRPNAGGGFDLRGVRRDEQADLDAGVVQAAACFRKRCGLPSGVETAFGGHFLAAFRHEADDFGLRLQRDGNDLGSVAHLQIQPGLDAAAEFRHVAVEDVPAVFTEMGRDAVRASGLADQRGFSRGRFAVVTSAIASFAQRGDVIDVDPELERHGSGLG